MVTRLLRVVLLVLATGTAAACPGATPEHSPPQEPLTATPSLRGQFLVAATTIDDPRFARSVILMISHDQDGAMGLIVNKPLGEGPLRSLLAGFGLSDIEAEGDAQLRYGGPVELNRGFVLHSTDYTGASTQVVGSGVAMSTGADILEAVARNDGPDRAIFFLGYAGWGPGQIEREIARDDWLTAPADSALVFSPNPDRTWDKVLEQAGLTL
jgi:putative transcriptional regulator